MDKKSFARLYSFIRKQIPLIILLCLLGIIASACGVKFSLLSKNVVDTAVKGSDILKPIIPLAVLLLVQLILSILHSVIYTVAYGKTLINMRSSIFKTVLRKDYLYISKFHSGELVNRINGDCAIICSAVFDIIPTLLSIAVKIVLGFLTLYSLDKTMALFCLILGPVILLVATVYRKRMKVLHKEARQYDGLLRSFMQESIRNLSVVKCFRAEDSFTAHGEIYQNKLYDVSVKRNMISILATLFYFVTMTSGYYIALAWGAYRLSLGLMSFGTLIAITDLVGQITAPFKSLSSMLPQYYSMAASIERLAEFDGIPSDKSEVTELSSLESINIENISFSYEDSKVLDAFSLTVNRGEIIALCGESGIGKSTLLSLITGVLHPQSGRVYAVTDKGDVDLDETTRAAFAYVPQNSMLISGTIAENICFTKKPDMDKLLKCAEIACIKDFILSLPDGFDTVLGEEGGGLSSGQIQRLAIARALYYEADVLLLDEATGALDEDTEQKVMSNIRNSRITCIAVTHRSTAINLCDKAYYI